MSGCVREVLRRKTLSASVEVCVLASGGIKMKEMSIQQKNYKGTLNLAD